MQKREFLINSIEKVKEFNRVASSYIEDIDVSRGRYVVNASSLLGIFSLDLSQPVEVWIHTIDVDRAEEFFKEVEEALRG